ncbi:aspartic peptidase domain-containing protein [Penicillium hetheringtonii]|uniref:Aspartic peptidase domain-containing protein n=1 Tax=Penicillium hetheringtonii TaxID=911720 RepID=A0AAD6DQL9_9EURO|nr:aspartic peptidase domain-containing protein [Penicillium hetheringtonii]
MKSIRARALLFGLPFCLVRAESQSEPLSLAADVNWYGIDGTWSAVNIYVGTELTISSLFPSTVDRGTKLIGEKACKNSSISDCPTKRGGPFDPYNSSTWKNQDESTSSKNSSVKANYGTDTILVDFTAVYEDQLIIINDKDTWIGFLGLSVRLSEHALSDHTDFSTFSMMEQAYINNSIAPSGTYGYTAGAHYRLKGVLASLTIGGVDQDRYITNDGIFHLTKELVPVVSLNTISISSSKGTFAHQITTSDPGTSSLYTLDSSTSYIWLPEKAFDAFGQAFNLTFDHDLGFYTYGNDTSLRQRLLAMDLSITLSISDFPNASHGVNIALPFQAFDHSLYYPFPNLSSDFINTSLPYIPIKMASTNEEQRIGRVFFQEAYLAVDYEKEQFSVYQAKFGEDLVNDSKNIVRIDSYIDKSLDLPSGKQGIPAGVKAGIGVGTAVGTILAIAVGVRACLYLRKRRFASEEKDENSDNGLTGFDCSSDRPVELGIENENRPEMASDNSNAVLELPELGLAELDANPSSISDLDRAANKPEERRIPRHSETQSSIATSLSSLVAESSDEEGPAPRKGHTTNPPTYTVSTHR